MIPGHPTKTTYRTIAAQDFGIPMCETNLGCTKGFGWNAHRTGRVDRAGGIHWWKADRRASRRGMRPFMKLMALVYHREWWTEPSWKKFYLTNTWATKEIQKRYHYRVRMAWSMRDRIIALERARKSGRKKTGPLRRAHPLFYKWIYDAGLVGIRAVQSSSQEGNRPTK